jgi:hypothetical protein
MARKPTLTVVENLDGEEEIDHAMPPASVVPAVRGPARSPAPDLTGKPKLWFVSGPGRSGKTTYLRWVAEQASNRGGDYALAAMDPANRSLKNYVEDVAEPPTNDAAAVTKWLEGLVEQVLREKITTLVDCGGGDTALYRLVSAVPSLADDILTAGVAPVAIYLLGPRTDDLAVLTTFERAGFQPAATALVLNVGLADPTVEREASFSRVRRHSTYRAAIERGAIELWMPWLDRAVVGDIEAKRVSFVQARDAVSPEGRTVAPLGPFNRARVRLWLDGMAAEMAPIRTWLP